MYIFSFLESSIHEEGFVNDFWAKCTYICTITGAGGSDHEEREAAEGFTELVPRLETTWNFDVVKANWENVLWLLSRYPVSLSHL